MDRLQRRLVSCNEHNDRAVPVGLVGFLKVGWCCRVGLERAVDGLRCGLAGWEVPADDRVEAETFGYL